MPLSSRKRQNASLSPVKLCVKAALRALGLAWLSLREDGDLGRQLSETPSWSGRWRFHGQLWLLCAIRQTVEVEEVSSEPLQSGYSKYN